MEGHTFTDLAIPMRDQKGISRHYYGGNAWAPFKFFKPFVEDSQYCLISYK